MRRILFFALAGLVFFSPLLSFAARQLGGVFAQGVVVALFWGAAVLILYLLAGVVLAEQKLRLTGINILDAIVALYTLLIVAQAMNPLLPSYEHAVRGLFESGQWIVFYLLARLLVSNQGRYAVLIRVIVLAALLQAAYGVVGLWIGVERIDPLMIEGSTHPMMLFTRRAVGTLGSPFSFGLLCAIGAAVALSQGIFSVKPIQRILLLFGVLVLTAGLLASGSRSSMFGLGASLVLLFGLGALRRKQRRAARTKRRMVAYTVSVALSVLAFASALVFLGGVGEYHVQQLASLMHPLQERNLLARFQMWRELSEIIASNPFGWGVGSLGSATYRYGEVIGMRVADNQYAETLVETGIIGLLFLMTLLVVVYVYGLRLTARSSSLGLASFLTCVVIVVAGIAAPPFKAFPANIMFGCLFGAMSGEYSRWRRRRSLHTSGGNDRSAVLEGASPVESSEVS